MDDLMTFLNSHFAHGLALMLLGMVAGWLLGYWRRHRIMKRIRGGDARDVINVEQILVKEQPDGRLTMRIRTLGTSYMQHVLANPVAEDAFRRRVQAASSTSPLVHVDDQMGSYLLHLLQPWVCGLCRSGPFPHDVWVMVPVCEPGVLSEYQTATVVLVRQADLKRFLKWEVARAVQVEHGSDGARVLTLWHTAHEFERQHEKVRKLKGEGKSSRFVETMYILDLGLDVEEVPLHTKDVPWQRFEGVLKGLGLRA